MKATRPLEDVLVLSMAEQYPGPYATLLLADLGARVIMIERPEGGDPARQLPAFFAAINRNKQSVVLDLKSRVGRDAIRRLAARTDVFLEGFRPGVAERLGVDYDTLTAANPRLIYASISGFGQTGPYRTRPAHDLSYLGLAGLLYRQAREHKTGETSDIPIGDLSAAMFAAIAVLTGMFARERTGKGTFVDVSVTDGLVSWMTGFLSPIMNGKPLEDQTLASPAYGAFICSDGSLLTLSIAHEDGFWQNLCRSVGLDEVAALNHSERILRSEELRRRIAASIRARTRDEWTDILDRADVPWSPIHDLTEVAQDPHLRVRGMFVQLASTSGSQEWHISQPLQFRGYKTDPTRPAPALGEHTEEVLREHGFSHEEIERVIRRMP